MANTTTSKNFTMIRVPSINQRCLIDYSTASKFNLKYGDFCALRISQQRVALCKVSFQPKSTTSSTIIYNDSITLRVKNNRKDNVAEIQKLNLFNSMNQSVKLSLVFTTAEDMLKCIKNKHNLISILKLTLRHKGVVENCVVDCTNSPIHSVFKISKIIINSTQNISENSVYVLTDKMEIEVDKFLTVEEFQLFNDEIELGGISEYFDRLKTLLKLPDDTTRVKFARSSIILHGPPGTGKTSLVRKLSENLKLRLINFNCARVWKLTVSESEETLNSVFKTAVDLWKMEQCILFLDNIDSICAINKSHTWMSKRIIALLQSLLDSCKKKHGLFVIAATNQIESIDPSLRHSKYFDEEILIGIPDCNQRTEILRCLVGFDAGIDFHHLAQSTPGYTAADLVSLCQRVKFEGEITTELFAKIIKDFSCTSKRINPEFQSTSTFATWSSIGGLEDVKYRIWETLDLQLNRPDYLAHYGLPKPKGILLYGPPGCCKTTLIKAAANDLKLNYLAITPNDIYSPYLGESEKAINEVFRKARANAPTILFIDELDAFVGSRIQSEQSTVHVRVLSTLLNEMDGIGIKMQDITSRSQSTEDGGVLVMAATNRPDLIDPALLRPGRFDDLIYLPPPDRDARKAILEVSLKNIRTENINLDKIADETELYSGVDLKNLCNEAGLVAMETDGITVDKITQRHFDLAISKYIPSLTPEEIDFYQAFHR